MSRNKLAVLVLMVGFIALVMSGMIQIPGLPNFGAMMSKIPIIGERFSGQSTGPSFGNSGGGNPLIDFLKSRWGVMLIIAGLLYAFRSKIPIIGGLSGWLLAIALLIIAWVATGFIPGMGGMNPLDVISGLFAQFTGWLQGLLPGQGGGKLPNIPSGPGLSLDSFKSVDGIMGLLKQYWWVLLLVGILFFLMRRGSIGGKMALILLVVGLIGGYMFLGGMNFNLGGFKLGSQGTGQQGNCRAYHTVKSGETLYRIGLQYGLSWTVICKANGLANPNEIYASQTLCIP